MNETIRTIKAKALDDLKANRAALVAQKEQKVNNCFARKKVKVDQDNANLDQAFEKYRTERMAAYSKEVAAKSEEVKQKKNDNIENAKIAAKAEVETELAAQLVEFDAEIGNLEEELGK